MTDRSAKVADAGTTTAAGRRSRPAASIVPGDNVAGRALAFVIAIMTFLSCITIGAVSLVARSAETWQGQIAREATIQIAPRDGLDMDEALEAARRTAEGFAGVTDARIVDTDETARLLEPWLGTGLDLDELPVPRLVIVTIDADSPPDFAALAAELHKAVPDAALDDHRAWVDRLVTMARATIAIGLSVLGLMLAATVMTVVFATRGAMAGNVHIIEVLHFVGAESRFIAREFRRHFLLVGLRGSVAGGALALAVFALFAWWASQNRATPQGDQAVALFGDFSVGWAGYLGVGLAVAFVAALTAITSHVTVLRQLSAIDAT